MGKYIKQSTNYNKALELKMWQNGPNYIVYLGGLPINITTGYATTGTGDCEEEFIMENNLSHTELCRTYFDAAKLYEKWSVEYM